jgi:hypothetical protein
MNCETAREDSETVTQAGNTQSDKPDIQEVTPVVKRTLQPHSQTFTMSSDDECFWNDRNTAFAIFFGATPTLLLALMFVLWAIQQI